MHEGGKKTLFVVLITVLSILLVALIGVLIYFSVVGNDSKNEEKQSASTNPPQIVVTSCPSQVTSENPYATISGTLVSENDNCTLTINGEVVTTAPVAGTQVQWSKSLQIQPGETKTLQIEAKDSNNLVTTVSKSIYCQQLNSQPEPQRERAPITPGCTLVKKKANGLNIREYPGTSYDIVDYIGPKDYSSGMVYTGHYRLDSEGYTWYEVIAPNGKHGYVRSVLVHNKAFVK